MAGYTLIFLVIACSNYIFTKRMTSFSWMTKKQFLLAGIADVATIGLCIFTIWKPIVYPGILFWVGNVIYILGLIFVIMSIVAFAKTPDDKLVTRGIYKVFRHPYYLGGYLSLIGIGLICKEWLIILGTIVSMILGFWSAKWEEEYLEETYGDEYIFHARDEAIFTPGSRRSGGFAISKPELMEKISEWLEGATMRVLARGRFTEDGQVTVPPEVGVKPGDKLLTVRGSRYGLAFVAQGPIYEEALKHLELEVF